MHDKWNSQIIQRVWNIIYRWELDKQYRKSQPEGAFFYRTWLDNKHGLFMGIAHVVAICEQLPDKILGNKGKEKLKELKSLYERAESEDRSEQDFEDCGIKAYRDKALAHPVNAIKDILGKPELKVSLTWKTVDETINKLKEFCAAVEEHNVKDWDSTSYFDETGTRCIRPTPRAN